MRGKRVLITAGAGGIGRVMSETFVKAGATVHICDVIQSAIDETVKALGVTATLCDVSDLQQVDQFFGDAQKHLGGLDVMIVIGGYNSSNTCNLARMCAEKVPTYHIAHPECLESAFAIRYRPAGGKTEIRATGWLPGAGDLSVGLTSGASTPDNLVGTAVKRLAELTGG